VTTALVVLLGAVVVSTTAPGWLFRLESSRLDPAAVLSCWWSAIGGVIGTVVLALVLLVVPDRAGVSVLGQLADLCVSALDHAGNPRLEELLAVVTAGVLGVLVVRIVYLGGRASTRRRRHVGGHLDLLGQIGGADELVLWVRHTTPLAFSIAGRRPVIIATSALSSALPPQAVQAVLAHERAHLSARHHLQVALAEAMSAALPGVPLFRHAPAAVRRLVEFEADAIAARLYGPAAVALALSVMARDDDSPGESLAMSGGDLDGRLLRLGGRHRPVGRGLSMVAHIISAAVSAALPAAAAGAMIVAVALVACS